MEIRVARQSLYQALSKIIGVVDHRQILPVLNHVKMVLSGDRMTLITTDSEMMLKSEVSLVNPVETACAFTLPAKKLFDICRSLPDSVEVKIRFESDWAVLQAEKSRFTLSMLSAADFPEIELGTALAVLALDKLSALCPLLQRTQFSMANQDVRHFLNGMRIEIGRGFIKTVAMDGHRLAINALSHEGAQTDSVVYCIVPRKAVTESLKLLSHSQLSDLPIEITISERHLQLKFSQFELITQLIESEYPNYLKLIPQEGQHQMRFNVQVFKEALQRTAILANENFRTVSLQIHNNALCIVTNNAQHEEANVRIPVEYTGEEVDVWFNINYLLDVCQVLRTEMAIMHLSPNEAGVLIEEVEGGKHDIFVIMPVKK